MLFTTPEFALFCAITFALYYLPWIRKVQLPVLIAASLFFYSVENPPLLLLLLSSVLINSFVSFQIDRAPYAPARLWAIGGVVVNLCILGFFKYAGLLSTALAKVLPSESQSLLEFMLHIPLPIGISFYTFEGISLVVDAFRRNAFENLSESPASRRSVWKRFGERLGKTSLFIAFFPHLVAGPILRAKDFLPQISEKYFRDIHWDTVIKNLITGYFLKMVIADNLKDYTLQMAFPFYANHDSLTNAVLLFGYSMQIFSDFAGYSLIAIGLGAAFGYRLPDNFREPYISRSLAEFWTRWHISLSSWLRDYLYIPLGGNRRGPGRTYLNLFIVMTLGGLWHGAAWSYAFWGFYHGCGLALERFAQNRFTAHFAEQTTVTNLRSVSARRAGVFIFVSVGWVFFSLPDHNDAFGFLNTIISLRYAPQWMIITPVALFSLAPALYHARRLPSIEARLERLAMRHSNIDSWSRAMAYGTMLLLLLLNSGTSTAFIYFQF